MMVADQPKKEALPYSLQESDPFESSGDHKDKEENEKGKIHR